MLALRLFGIGRPFSIISCLNLLLLSAASIAAVPVPRTLTLCFDRTPFSLRSIPAFKAVCPPKPSSMPSGLSRSITFSRNWDSIGTKYARSTNLESDWIVAMFGLTSTTLMPSSLSALMA